VIVVVDPARDFRSGVIHAKEQALVEKLVAHPAVEAFTESVLHGLAGRNEMPGDLGLLSPGEHGARRELRAVVGDDGTRLAAPNPPSSPQPHVRAKRQ